MIRIFFLIVLLGSMPTVFAQDNKLNVLACEPEWAALAHALAGDYLKITSATTSMQDPHHIQARPSLIAKARNADLLICSGAELEVGWLPLLLRKSANSAIQPGGTGYFLATDQVELLNKREFVDRSEGDVHGAGNPHIHFDPRRMLMVADLLATRLIQLLPDHRESIEKSLIEFKLKLASSLQKQRTVMESLNGKRVVVHHDNWVYLVDWLGLRQVAELEPKPGLPPSSSHLTDLVVSLERDPADVIIYASYQSDKPANWLSSRTNIPAQALPYSVENWEAPMALIEFYSQLITRLYAATKE